MDCRRCCLAISGCSSTRWNDNVAHSLAVRPSVGPRTWTVIDEGYRTVAPVEEWLEAHRHLWSPNTVRGYATVAGPVVDVPRAARRGRAVAGGRRPGGVGVPVLVAQRPHGRARPGRPEDGPSAETLEARLAAVISFYRWQEAVFEVPVAARLLRGAPRRGPARGLLAHLDSRSAPGPSSLVRVRRHRSARAPAAAAAPGDPGDPRRLRRPRPGDRGVGRATCVTGCCSRCWRRPACGSARCWACGSATS